VKTCSESITNQIALISKKMTRHQSSQLVSSRARPNHWTRSCRRCGVVDISILESRMARGRWGGGC